MTPPVDALLAAFRRYNIAQPDDDQWQPTGDDWTRLAIAMAIKHKEDGFEFEWPRASRFAEARFTRDGLMTYFMQSEGKSAAQAAVLTAKAIAAQVKAGHRDPMPEISAKSIESDYSNRMGDHRRAEHEAGRALPGEVPPFLKGYLQFRELFDGLFNAARRMTVSRDH